CPEGVDGDHPTVAELDRGTFRTERVAVEVERLQTAVPAAAERASPGCDDVRPARSERDPAERAAGDEDPRVGRRRGRGRCRGKRRRAGPAGHHPRPRPGPPPPAPQEATRPRPRAPAPPRPGPGGANARTDSRL